MGLFPVIENSSSALHRNVILVACAALYFTLAVTTILLTSANGSIATVWPANAVLLALMLQRERREWPWVLLAGIGANLLANIVTRGTFWAPILFGCANMLEILVAALGLHGIIRQSGDKPQMMDMVLRFVLWAGVIAPLASSLCGAGTAWLVFGQPFGESLITWVAADSLGLLIFTPFFYSLIAGDYLRCFHDRTFRQRLETVALLALTLLVTIVVFASQHFPILFLVATPLMIVTFRLGWPGLKLAITIAAVVGTVGTAMGHGPISLLPTDAVGQAFFFQFFMASLLLTQLPVAAALAMRDDLVRQLRESENSIRMLASYASILMIKFSPAGQCIKAVGQCDRLPGLIAEDLPGMDLPALSKAVGVDLEQVHREAIVQPGMPVTIEFQPSPQHPEWLEVAFRAVWDEDGNPLGTSAAIQDITGRKRYEASLVDAARTDALTDVMNRAGFMARLELIGQGRPENEICLAMIDVDRFKQINDGHGHMAGDAVLTAIAGEIRKHIRDSDAVGRLGGDEFVILLEGTSLDQAREICRRIVESIGARPLRLVDDTILDVKISCGLAQMGPDDSLKQLMHNADIALYEAKGAGRGRLCVFDSGGAVPVRMVSAADDELVHALEKGEFDLYFQPIVTADSYRIEGFEALLRWNHPARGMLLPSEFITTAERSGQIVRIGAWVLQEACTVATQFAPDMRVSVNVSPVQFHRPGLVEAVVQALASSGLDANRLELEITESVLLETAEDTMRTLRTLKALGVRIALDDFGVGFSGLNYLLGFPVDRLKIDRSFVNALKPQPAAKSVIKAIIRTARVLRIEATAEGVENEEQFHELRKLGCTSMQGYLFGRPVNREQCLRMVRGTASLEGSLSRVA